jgi:hypothetical protein
MIAALDQLALQGFLVFPADLYTIYKDGRTF